MWRLPRNELTDAKLMIEARPLSVSSGQAAWQAKKTRSTLAGDGRSPLGLVVHVRNPGHVRRDGTGVDEDIDPSVAICGDVDVTLGVGRIGEINRVNRADLQPFALGVGDRRGRGIGVDVAPDHRRALSGEAQRDALSDSSPDAVTRAIRSVSLPVMASLFLSCDGNDLKSCRH